MRREALAVSRYVERMIYPSGMAVEDYLPNDEIPETLIPVLQRMMREQMPCLADTAQRLADWKNDNPAEPIPRTIGFHEFVLEDVRAERAVLPYSIWLHGRALDSYKALAGDDKNRADQLLTRSGGEVFMTTDIPAPVKLENYVLQWQE